MELTRGEVSPSLSPELAALSNDHQLHLDEKTFRWMHNLDAMATEKLADGIRKFNIDTRLLEQFARTRVDFPPTRQGAAYTDYVYN
jgi:transaldolase